MFFYIFFYSKCFVTLKNYYYLLYEKIYYFKKYYFKNFILKQEKKICKKKNAWNYNFIATKKIKI